jgi:Tol biopolymer transport system component
MSLTLARGIAPLVPLGLLFGCGTDSATDPRADMLDEPPARSVAYSGWPTPVKLGASINSPFNEQNATLSKDGLRLYFTSNRSGNLDMWVSRRSSADSPFWEPAENLGSPVNSSTADFAPSLSIDGHLLFFSSNRDGNNDIYVSHRTNKDDDFGWSEPVKLGRGVNTTDMEQAPMYLQSAEDGSANLYFNRGSNALGLSDIYSATVKRDGETIGPAVLVSELSVPGATDAAATVRKDGKEVFFFSTRSGTVGGIDLWTSTRQSVRDAWSEPVNVAALNTTSNEQTPSLSFDGRTLVFASNRPGSLGNDIWMTTRALTDDE